MFKKYLKMRRDPKEHRKYMEKLNESYKICREELKEPEPDWEDKIHQTKFTIDKLTNKPKTEHIFILNYPDEIDISLSKLKNKPEHNYVFKRSTFYEKFKNPKSRIRNELFDYYRLKKFSHVDLFYNHMYNRWCLKLCWKNTEIQNC